MVLTGTGFVSGTVLTASSGTVTTTYNSPTSITAQVTLPASASGNLSLAAQNPTPGGGTGAALVLPIAALTMTATNPDGTANNGTAQLGVQVNLLTSIVNGAVSSRAWTLQGAGTLTPSGSQQFRGSLYAACGNAGKHKRDHYRDHDCESYCLHLVYADIAQSRTGSGFSESDSRERGWNDFGGLDRNWLCIRNGLNRQFGHGYDDL